MPLLHILGGGLLWAACVVLILAVGFVLGGQP